MPFAPADPATRIHNWCPLFVESGKSMTVRRLLMAKHFGANCREQERTVRQARDTGTSALFLDVLTAHV